jgi:hypothetical protein
LEGGGNRSEISIKARRIAFWAVILLILAFIINKAVLPRFGHKFIIDSGGLKYGEYRSYSDNESRVLKILVEDTPVLGKIPRKEYLAMKTGLSLDNIAGALESLAEKGDIVIGDSLAIIDAYPWIVSDIGIRVHLLSDQDSISGPLFAAGALYSLSAALLLDSDIRVEARLKDTAESLVIDIRDGKISYTNHIEAVVYNTEEHKYSRFYISARGAEADHPHDFDIKKVIRLDRALLIGDIIAGEIKEKTGKHE